MDRFIDQIVARSIRHSRLMLRQGSYNWPVARLALRKILADLEARARTIQACRGFAPLSPRKTAHGCVRTVLSAARDEMANAAGDGVDILRVGGRRAAVDGKTPIRRIGCVFACLVDFAACGPPAEGLRVRLEGIPFG
jgi:hypothetical protein